MIDIFMKLGMNIKYYQKCSLHDPVRKLMNGFTPLNKIITKAKHRNKLLNDFFCHADGRNSKLFHTTIPLRVLL